MERLGLIFLGIFCIHGIFGRPQLGGDLQDRRNDPRFRTPFPQPLSEIPQGNNKGYERPLLAPPLETVRPPTKPPTTTSTTTTTTTPPCVRTTTPTPCNRTPKPPCQQTTTIPPCSNTPKPPCTKVDINHHQADSPVVPKRRENNRPENRNQNRLRLYSTFQKN